MTGGGAPRVAIRGSGSIGMRHARVLSSLGAQVVVVPERIERVAELIAAGFEAAPPGAGPSGVDGTIVCTRTGLHRASAGESSGALLVEKPLAVDADDAGLLLAAAESRGQPVHVAYCLRFNPGIRFLAERIEDVGEVDAVDAECHSWLPGWRPGRDYRSLYSATAGEGGVLRDLSHEIDLVNHLLGPGRCVAAHLDMARALDLGPGVDESAVIVTMHGNVPATIRLSFARRPESRRLRIFGRRGTLEWDAIGRAARHLAPDGAVLGALEWGDPGAMYEAQARAWLSVLRGGDTPALATGSDGLQTLHIIDAARSLSSVGAC